MFEKLIKAIKASSEAEAQKLIAEMSEQAINQITNTGNTALTLAAMKGLENVCEALIPKMSQEAIKYSLEFVEAKEKQFIIEKINNYNKKLIEKSTLILDENNTIKLIIQLMVQTSTFRWRNFSLKES
ncbi:MAG TPA: ankyrin repeat domain-containing protein [Rickettsia endosymbiont of Bembidion lapponicum]|nr:ankyrin repeat domain-containing protein [Rickettsia endosymbiont of Bembidion lapponicum]